MNTAAYIPIRNKRAKNRGQTPRIWIVIVLAQPHAEEIFKHYNSPAIAAGYGHQEYITPCERLLFSTYISSGMAILDIGVGGGRTSQYLARNASRYVGVDYAPEMVRICRRKYPQWEYLEASATDLSPLQSESFDVVVLSYNMLDDLIPDETRWRCLQECHRVLRDNGLLIFSSHNPRAILVRTNQETAKLCRPAHLQGAFGRIDAVFRDTLNQSAKLFTSAQASLRRVFSYGSKSPFWRGEGYLIDAENLMTHFWTPKKAIAELAQCGFRFIILQGDDYPRKSHLLITDWYYYVFRKVTT
jgi:SAM-dependent methyltransferase